MRGIGIAGAVFAVMLLVLASGARARANARPASVTAATLTPDAFESRVLALVNQERAKRGLSRLARARCPDAFAARWSSLLARRETLRHQRVSELLDACGARRAAENIGTSGDSAEAVMQSWMRSRRHRASILDPRYRAIGVGAARSRSGRWYVVQNFLAF